MHEIRNTGSGNSGKLLFWWAGNQIWSSPLFYSKITQFCSRWKCMIHHRGFGNFHIYAYTNVLMRQQGILLCVVLSLFCSVRFLYCNCPFFNIPSSSICLFQLTFDHNNSQYTTNIGLSLCRSGKHETHYTLSLQSRTWSTQKSRQDWTPSKQKSKGHSINDILLSD